MHSEEEVNMRNVITPSGLRRTCLEPVAPPPILLEVLPKDVTVPRPTLDCGRGFGSWSPSSRDFR